MQVVSHSLEVMEVRWTSVTMYQPSASSLHPTLPCLHHCYSQSRLIAPLSASLHCNHLPLFPPLSLQVVSHSLEPGGILMPPSPPLLHRHPQAHCSCLKRVQRRTSRVRCLIFPC